MIIRDVLKARSLWCTWVTHNEQFFIDGQRDTDIKPNFDSITLFEVVAWNYRGKCLIVRKFEGVKSDDPRPQVAWCWVHSRYLEKVASN